MIYLQSLKKNTYNSIILYISLAMQRSSEVRKTTRLKVVKKRGKKVKKKVVGQKIECGRSA